MVVPLRLEKTLCLCLSLSLLACPASSFSPAQTAFDLLPFSTTSLLSPLVLHLVYIASPQVIFFLFFSLLNLSATSCLPNISFCQAAAGSSGCAELCLFSGHNRCIASPRHHQSPPARTCIFFAKATLRSRPWTRSGDHSVGVAAVSAGDSTMAGTMYPEMVASPASSKDFFSTQCPALKQIAPLPGRLRLGRVLVGPGAPISLRTHYAFSGTDLACATTVLKWRVAQRYVPTQAVCDIP
eukprot:3940817-Rhodomonas_salina.3